MVSGTEYQVANSVKCMLVYFTGSFCSFSEAFSHPGDEGMGTQKPCFQFRVVHVLYSCLLVWGLSPCCAAGCLSEQCWVSGVRKSYFIVFPLQDNLGTTGRMGRARRCVVTA